MDVNSDGVGTNPMDSDAVGADELSTLLEDLEAEFLTPRGESTTTALSPLGVRNSAEDVALALQHHCSDEDSAGYLSCEDLGTSTCIEDVVPTNRSTHEDSTTNRNTHDDVVHDVHSRSGALPHRDGVAELPIYFCPIWGLCEGRWALVLKAGGALGNRKLAACAVHGEGSSVGLARGRVPKIRPPALPRWRRRGPPERERRNAAAGAWERGPQRMPQRMALGV